jgi:hypothetical protein
MKTLTLLLSTTLLTTSLLSKELTLIPCPSTEVMDIDKLTSQRLITPDGQGSQFLFRVKAGTKSVYIDERPRTSRVAKDFATLIQISSDIIGFRAKEFKDQCVIYKQSFKRSSVHLETIDETNNTTVYSFRTGKKENLYLTTDMPITSIKELNYDTKTDTVSEKEQPASFYLGVNYKIGDIYTHYPLSEFYKNFSLKAMAKISKRPTESMGFGLSYPLSEGIEVFVAKLWTRDRGEDVGDTTTITYGVSFDLNRGLEWIQNIY